MNIIGTVVGYIVILVLILILFRVYGYHDHD